MSPQLSFPLLALFGATRGMAGAGLGLLLADRIAHSDRKKLGIALLAVGAASTIPLAMAMFRRKRRSRFADAGMMDPLAESYGPTTGVMVEEAEIWPPARAPNIRP